MDTKLAKNSSGYYEIRYAEKREPDGAWITRRVSCRTRARQEAEAFRRAWLRETLTGGLTPGHKATGPTIKELVGFYQRHHPGAEGQAWGLGQMVKAFGALSPADLTLDEVDAYTTDRMRVVAGSTVRRELGALLAALNFCAKHGKLDKAEVPSLVLPGGGQAREVFLDEEQEARVYALAMGDSLGQARLSVLSRFVALALDTAARKGAIEGLTWDRVDLSAGTIDYRDPLIPVSRKRRVVVPISDRLYPVLNRARREATTRFVLDGAGVRSCWERFVAEHALGDLVIHDLRRTWATLAARAGVSLFEIAGVLGDDIRTVMKHYARHQPGHLRGAVNRRWTGD